MNKVMEHTVMTLLRLRKAAQLTLPAEMRAALNVGEGDYLEAEVVDQGVLLRPVSVVARRQHAWNKITQAAASVRDLEQATGATGTLEEERIATEVTSLRRRKPR